MNKWKILWRNVPVTMGLIAIFILLFLLQVMSGVNINHPRVADIIEWGGNALPFSMGIEYWRILTSAFIHIGLQHLLFNAMAMFFFGIVAEVIFGRWYFLLLFLLSAVSGNMLNNYWSWHNLIEHNTAWSVAAGASGGIMGIGAALLTLALIGQDFKGLMLDKKQLLILMAINLGYGFFVSGIDNTAHIGGAIMGMTCAIIFYCANRIKRPQLAIISSTILVLLLVGSWCYLHNEMVAKIGQFWL